MLKIKFVSPMFFLLLLTSMTSTPFAQAATDPSELMRAFSEVALKCGVQTFRIPPEGNPINFAIVSRCAEMRTSRDRAMFLVDGRRFTVIMKESEFSDGGDIQDVYIQYNSDKNQEVLVAQNVLAFGDPVLAVLLLTGHSCSELPTVELN